MTGTRTRSHAGLASVLRISVGRLARRMRAQGDHPLSVTQFAALACLERHHAMTPRELADHEKVQPPSMTRVIAVLEERGLLARTPHPTDRRQILVRVTDAGRTLLEEERRHREAWLAKKLAELTPQERATLRAAAPVLEKLSQA